MHRETYFITGTDTGVGKTLVASALLLLAGAEGLRTLALKPIAAGSTATPQGLRNEDALLLQSLASEALPYEQVNPVALLPAIAPHLALADADWSLTAEDLAARCRPSLQRDYDFAVVEGAGGWRVPLNAQQTLADFARLLGYPVVLVVGLRLGCINHALLSAEAIRADGLALAGWVGTQIDGEMQRVNDNLATLERLLDAPRLGFVPFQRHPTASTASQFLRLPRQSCR
jgi:dethiobiotin synthetase